jgi:hypothetical protein
MNDYIAYLMASLTQDKNGNIIITNVIVTNDINPTTCFGSQIYAKILTMPGKDYEDAKNNIINYVDNMCKLKNSIWLVIRKMLN